MKTQVAVSIDDGSIQVVGLLVRNARYANRSQAMRAPEADGSTMVFLMPRR